MEEQVRLILKESIAVKESLCQTKTLAAISALAKLVIGCLKNGGKIILFGNGGSAADSQHIAAELVGRFSKERKALAAIALNCNSSNLTSIGNDYDFTQIFSRQLEGIGQSTDLAIGISTSGKSANVIMGITRAKEMGMKTAVLIGSGNRELTEIVDVSVCVPSENTAYIQEAHITIGHIVCKLVDKVF